MFHIVHYLRFLNPFFQWIKGYFFFIKNIPQHHYQSCQNKALFNNTSANKINCVNSETGVDPFHIY